MTVCEAWNDVRFVSWYEAVDKLTQRRGIIDHFVGLQVKDHIDEEIAMLVEKGGVE